MSTDAKTRALGRKYLVVDAAVYLVAQRQVAARLAEGGLLFGGEVRAVDGSRTETGVALRFKKVEFVGKGKAEFHGKIAPVVFRVGRGEREDFFVVAVLQVPAEISSPVAKALGDGALLGGQL